MLLLKSFPPPLTAEEEACFLRKYAEGDQKARHILIERNLRLVAHVMKKYQYLEDDPEAMKITQSLSKVKSNMVMITFYFE